MTSAINCGGTFCFQHRSLHLAKYALGDTIEYVPIAQLDRALRYGPATDML